MKIGIDCRLWDETGLGRYTRNLVKELQILDKKNNYTLFVLSKDREEILKQVQNDKFKIIETDVRWHTIEEQLKFPAILKKYNLDLVHFPYFSVPIFYNRPFVVTIHDLILHHFPTGQASTLPGPIYNLKLLGYKFVIAKIARKAKKILTVSQATKDEIIDHLGVDSKKVVVTYEGVENSKLPTSLKLCGASKILNTKYFLYIGNAYPHKNLERLLEAFNMLIDTNDKRMNTNISLVLVGKEDYFYKRLREKVNRMELKDSVIFHGEVTEGQLLELYKNAMALVVPSLMEGFGLTALEAMANKCLVLCSDIPSLREVCADAAIYFDPYNIENIKNRMEEVLNDSNHLTGNIEKGKERVKLFSWEKMANETLAVYEKVATNR